MSKRNIPFNPFMGDLYSADTLLGAYQENDPGTFQATLDFRTYRYFVMSGRYAPGEYFDAMMQSLHDNDISQSLNAFLQVQKRVVAIMGGHKMKRNSPEYAMVVGIARRLAREGTLVISGGGPGAMEATHLGAFLAKATDDEVNKALSHLAPQHTMPPNAGDVVAKDGTVNTSIADALHAWYKPAFEILRNSQAGASSLSIPTWYYGHEPPTPFATHIAKYFQNSIREDGLLAVGRHGIVFTEGKAGTLQEIFQDAAQNYYKSYDWFSPMVFLGTQYWTKTLPAVAVLQQLFDPKSFSDLVLVTDSPDAAVEFLLNFKPPTP